MANAEEIEKVVEGGLIALAGALSLSAADPVIAAAAAVVDAMIKARAGKLAPLDAAAVIKAASGAFGANDTEVDGEAALALGKPAGA